MDRELHVLTHYLALLKDCDDVTHWDHSVCVRYVCKSCVRVCVCVCVCACVVGVSVY